MDYSEYTPLTPINDIKDGNEYIKALNWAFQEPRIKNIALTGPYGSGKSSIIETFLKQDEESRTNKCILTRGKSIRKSSLIISMATFVKGYFEVDDAEKDNKEIDRNKSDEEKNKIVIGSDEIEKGILKQLFYKVKPSKIPQSRYRKLHIISNFAVFVRVMIFFILSVLFVSIFAPTIFEDFIQRINLFLQTNVTFSVNLWIMVAGLLVTVSAIFTYLYRVVFSKFRVIEIKLPTDATVQNKNEESDSVFNKNLDEIVYFFESTGYRIVFFEDLDRLDNTEIFIHLREVNNLLNNDDSIKNKPIVFVYAVRDDIFSKEDRTKFFDFIIPVIPVINSTNSGEILLQKIHEAKDNGIEHKISQEFVLDVSPFISDMRILQNIYNEFVVYKETLSTAQELYLSDEQMFAMIIFKNLYPSDFSDIQAETGILKEAFDGKNRFILEKQQSIQNEINNYSKTIECYQKDTLKSVRELKYAMFGELMGGLGKPIDLQYNNIDRIDAETIMGDDYDMTQLLTRVFNRINYYDDGRSKSNTVTSAVLEEYINRWKSLNTLREMGLKEVQERIQSLEKQKHEFSGMSIMKLLEKYTLGNVISSRVLNNRLLVFFLRRGYIDEKYANYINYFKGTSITKDDMNFILSVKNQEPLAFDYPLIKTSMVIQKLQGYEFEEKAIYNFALLEQLLLEGSSTKLNAFVVQLSDGHENSWKFIDEFVTLTVNLDEFIRLLSEHWVEMWYKISTNEALTYDRQIFYLKSLLNAASISTIIAQNKDRCLTVYFEQHDDILQQLIGCEPDRVNDVVNRLDICFDSLQIEGVSGKVIDNVFDNCYYELNDTMIHTVVSYKNAYLADQLSEQPYTTILKLEYNPLIRYIYDNFESYVREIILVHSLASDRAEDVVDMIVRLNGLKELQLQIIKHENFHLDSITDCAGDYVKTSKEEWHSVWVALLAENIVAVSWENIVAYWNMYKLSNELKEYISEHADELSVLDNSAIGDEFVKSFIEANFEDNIERKLIPILRMDEFNIELSELNQSTLQIMIDCHYFDFTDDRYSTVASVSSDLGVIFINKNPDEFMAVRANIAMSFSLFENLIYSDHIHKHYKDKLFAENAEVYMTERVAICMKSFNLPVTVGIFNAAWNCVEHKHQAQLLFDYCNILGADNLEQRFKELGGKYADLADRTRRHDVILPFSKHHKKLAEHLEEIGYITSIEEKEFYEDLEQKKYKKEIKLRVKRIKKDD